jgi:5'(3')-deoxyribonucleotidase
MQKRIAIDLNDVVRDYSGQFINCYQKLIDPKFEMKDEDITSFDFSECFPFKSKSEYNNFKYTDAAFELHARAEMTDNRLQGILTDWTDNILTNLDVDEDPEVFFFSPFELGITISATLSFLAAHGVRAREYYFPVNSMTIYDKCDILITANPNLVKNCPEDKTVIMIDRPYNKNVETKYLFRNLFEAIKDEHETIIKLIEGKE